MGPVGAGVRAGRRGRSSQGSRCGRRQRWLESAPKSVELDEIGVRVAGFDRA